MHLRGCVTNGLIRPQHWRGCSTQLHPLQVNQALTVIRGKHTTSAKWKPPDPPWIKINIAAVASGSDNRATGGGVIRDHDGKLLIAFATPYASLTQIEAEALIALQGVSLAKELGKPLLIESGDQQVISLISNGMFGPANIRHTMASIRLFLKNITFKAGTVNRRGNRVAILMAQQALETMEAQLFDTDTAPPALKALIRLDQIGLMEGDGEEDEVEDPS